LAARLPVGRDGRGPRRLGRDTELDPHDQPALYCFRVVLHEEWWHHHFATRDLAMLG
jgi:hypothetical protein